MSDLVMLIHEKLKGLPIDKNLIDTIGELVEEVLQNKWAVGFRDRGMGHGDYAVIEKDTEVVIVKCPYLEIAEHIAATHNTAPSLLNQRNELLEACQAVDVSIHPYRGDDASATKTYTISGEACKKVRTALGNMENKQ